MNTKMLAITGVTVTWFLALAAGVAPVLVQAAATKVVAPGFEDHDVPDAILQFSTEQTMLGANSVKMSIPAGDDWGQGLNVEVTTPGVVGGLGLSRYRRIIFKAQYEGNDPGSPGTAPLYVSLILYDRTNDVWVSMIPTCDLYVCWGGVSMSFSEPDSGGWRTAKPGTDLWTAWRFDGKPWEPAGTFPWDGDIPRISSLSDWDDYVEVNNLNVKVKKVNIQFGYRPVAYGGGAGTVYVDGLATHGFILDFEP